MKKLKLEYGEKTFEQLLWCTDISLCLESYTPHIEYYNVILALGAGIWRNLHFTFWFGVVFSEA